MMIDGLSLRSDCVGRGPCLDTYYPKIYEDEDDEIDTIIANETENDTLLESESII